MWRDTLMLCTLLLSLCASPLSQTAGGQQPQKRSGVKAQPPNMAIRWADKLLKPVAWENSEDMAGTLPVDSNCQKDEQRLAELEGELKDNKEQMKTADPQQRHNLAQRNGSLVKQIADLKVKLAKCKSPMNAMTKIKHLIVVIQENHSFDSYFGRYCQAQVMSNPSCTSGPSCCERGPDTQPGGVLADPKCRKNAEQLAELEDEYQSNLKDIKNADPQERHILAQQNAKLVGQIASLKAKLSACTVSKEKALELTDAANQSYDPKHDEKCEIAEIDGGLMDHFVYGTACSSQHNFVYATDKQYVGLYWGLAQKSALADRYFQPIAGASTPNDMYFATAGSVFNDRPSPGDNPGPPEGAIGTKCTQEKTYPTQSIKTIGDLLVDAGWSFAIYLEGYQQTVTSKDCPAGPPECSKKKYPCVYDPGDNAFAYFKRFQNDPLYNKDFSSLFSDINHGELPTVTFVRSLGYKSEHPGVSTVTAGAAFVSSIVQKLDTSAYAKDTLLLITWDESGGFFDHVPPPSPNPGDNQPYGPRVPLLAYGKFAKVNKVSHVVMEHSSIVKFIEWNWLGGLTGQLGRRDAHVNNIGSLLDPTVTSVPVPAK
jgi:phospholipase C